MASPAMGKIHVQHLDGSELFRTELEAAGATTPEGARQVTAGIERRGRRQGLIERSLQ